MSKTKENVIKIPKFEKIFSFTGNNAYKLTDKKILNKYISFEHLEKSIRKETIAFVSPKTWQDPFERLYYNANFEERYKYKQPNIFCMCLTENSAQNEAASWKIYQNGTNEKMIKVKFNVVKMLRKLDEFCIKERWSIYIGKIDYSFSSDQIKGLYLGEKSKKYFPQDFSDEHYFKLLLLKRKAFKFEQEVRMFLVPDKERFFIPGDENSYLKHSKDLPVDLLHIPFKYDNETIDHLIIAPLQPFPLGDPRQKYHDELQKAEFIIYSKVLQNLLRGVDSKKFFKQSSLYNIKEKIII